MKITSFEISLENQAALQNAFNKVEKGRFWHWKRTYCLNDPDGKIHFVVFNILDRFVRTFSFIESLSRIYFGNDYAIARLPSLQMRDQLNRFISSDIVSDEEACELAKRGLYPKELFANTTHSELRSLAERLKRFSADALGFISFKKGRFKGDEQDSIRHLLNFLLIKKEIGCFWHTRCGFAYCPNPSIQTLGDLLKDKIDFSRYPENYFKEFTEEKGHAFAKDLINNTSSSFCYLKKNNQIAERESIIDQTDFKIIDDYRRGLKSS